MIWTYTLCLPYSAQWKGRFFFVKLSGLSWISASTDQPLNCISRQDHLLYYVNQDVTWSYTKMSFQFPFAYDFAFSKPFSFFFLVFCLSVKAACAVMWCNVSYFILSLLIASKTLYWPIVIYLHLIPNYFWKPPWVYQKFINCNQSVYVSTILSSDLPITMCSGNVQNKKSFYIVIIATISV